MFGLVVDDLSHHEGVWLESGGARSMRGMTLRLAVEYQPLHLATFGEGVSPHTAVKRKTMTIRKDFGTTLIDLEIVHLQLRNALLL